MTDKTKTTKKPELELIPLDGIAISAPTQDVFKTLMRVFELDGRKALRGFLPTECVHVWEDNRERTCVAFGDEMSRIGKGKFTVDEQGVYIENGKTPVPALLFYESQGLTQGRIEEINEWYDSRMRASA